MGLGREDTEEQRKGEKERGNIIIEVGEAIKKKSSCSIIFNYLPSRKIKFFS